MTVIEVLSVPLSKIPSERRTLYYVVVSCVGQPNQREVYSMALNQRLPLSAVPLRTSAPDVVLDLQELVDRCYEVGRYDQWIDYSRQPVTTSPSRRSRVAAPAAGGGRNAGKRSAPSP